MNTIVALAISQLSHGEMHRTVSTLPTILEALGNPLISRQLEAIEVAHSNLQALMQTAKSSHATEDIHKTNDDLDSLIPVLINGLESAIAQREFFPEKADAASVVLTRISHCDRKKLIHGSYGDQLSLLEVLVKDLLSEEFSAALATSGSQPMVLRIQTLMNQLQELLTARLQESKTTTTQTEQRKIINYRLDKLIAYIDINITDNIDGFSAVQEPVNELFTEVMGSYRSRVARKATME